MVPPVVATDKGIETRRHIVDVASRAFAEHGYAGTSLNDVIRASGVTKGGFYFHFDSKAALALAVLDHVRSDWQASILAATAGEERAADRLATIMRALVAHKATHPAAGAVDRLCQELSQSEPDVREHIRHFHGWFEVTGHLLEQARAEGDLDPTTDIASAARFIVAAFVGADHLADLTGESLQESLEPHISYSLRAVGLQT
jgi:AcrR family transcriptional regulator